MTAHPHHRPHPAFDLDAEDLGALNALAGRASMLKPFLRPALVIRLQLAAMLVGYIVAGTAIASALPLLPRPALHEPVAQLLSDGRA